MTVRQPSTAAAALQAPDGIAVRTAGTQCYLTASADPQKPWQESAARSFAALAALLKSKGIAPIQEQVYAEAGVREELLEIRRSAYQAQGLDPALPFAFIDGKPAAGGRWSGAQVWGVAGGSVATVAGPGRLWSSAEGRLLYIPALRGGDGPAPLQAERMFRKALAALKAHGFSYRQMVRTWIYLRRLLEWYGDLNKVRNELYGGADFLGPDPAAFPASTGIQGRQGDEECFMNVLAFAPAAGADASLTPVLHTARQGQAFSYRSAFSRAMVLRLGGLRTVYVSGTASIDGSGASVYRGDREGQALQTLLSVSALLEEQGARLEDIQSATLYCADRETFDAYRRLTRLLGIPAFPTIAVRADVCRPELLIELEAVAVVPA
ncbi:MAG: Rid family hydrolase [Elusimicrobia bacterium]|nr:Rid family hydrolase [Elusimicrobiota bacterium]